MAKTYLRGTTWYITYQDDLSKQRRKSLGRITEEEAKRIEAEYNKRIIKIPTLNHFADRYLEWHEAEYPNSHYRIKQIFRDWLLPVFGERRLTELENFDIEEYKNSRLIYAKAGTVAKELRTLKACLNKAIEWKLLKDNPAKYVKAPRSLDSKPIHFYTAEQLNVIYDHSFTPAYAAKWRLLANTGMRRAEALNFRWEHVTPNGIVIASTEENRTKSGKWRIVPLSTGARAALQVLQKEYGKNPYVFPRMNKRSLSRAFKRTLNRARLEGSIHSLRHTFASHLVMNRVSIRVVQQYMGHANIKTTEQYSHLSPDYLDQQAQELDL